MAGHGREGGDDSAGFDDDHDVVRVDSLNDEIDAAWLHDEDESLSSRRRVDGQRLDHITVSTEAECFR